MGVPAVVPPPGCRPARSARRARPAGGPAGTAGRTLARLGRRRRRAAASRRSRLSRSTPRGRRSASGRPARRLRSRASSSASPASCSRCSSVQLARAGRAVAAAGRSVTRRRAREVERSARPRRGTACPGRRRAGSRLAQLRVAARQPRRRSCITTKPGRFWFSLPEAVGHPRPEARAAPAGSCRCSSEAAPATWLFDVGVARADERHVVDALAPRCGNRSRDPGPAWPCCANLNGDSSSLARPASLKKPGRADRPGSGLPSRRSSSGLGSNSVHLARPAVHEQEDDGLRLRRRSAAASGRAGRRGGRGRARREHLVRASRPASASRSAARAGAARGTRAAGRRRRRPAIQGREFGGTSAGFERDVSGLRCSIDVDKLVEAGPGRRRRASWRRRRSGRPRASASSRNVEHRRSSAVGGGAAQGDAERRARSPASPPRAAPRQWPACRAGALALRACGAWWSDASAYGAGSSCRPRRGPGASVRRARRTVYVAAVRPGSACGTCRCRPR